ncbi:TPA: lactonase family protein [Burkholderia vietnamiensis]|uniref:3-carboxymuconate cyclase-like protein n=2 Tax=Burkholderia vietnamiensis TaxID=60552 RepID=A4JGK7_BURVG|nr:lactonase family protein [Burkholderia vietnamiensis]ABO55410.1 3-carboxymuconate cyclase-like protein [Burkholderia vietnamiensis G4]MCA8209705.1 lactonase family protein [Burkholderia vietnamiensis]MCB4345160.1 lactonase family protein [Burkholderia vietnamiensis]PRH39298.1 lactonase family protein [Burkholderia vietnamiensis]HDR9098819.1 lactonase family protein [Burkholderia vietnamiensis]
MPNRLREHDARAATRGSPLRLAHWMKGFALVLSLSATHAFAQQAPAAADGVYNLLVGTYTGHGSEGIYVYRFDTKTGSVAPVSSAKTVNPSYLLPSRDGRTVYAVNELPGDNGPATQRGGISAFGFDPKTGTLTFIDRVSSEGNDPCYLALSPDGKYVVTANYSVAADPGGSFAVFPVRDGGAVGTAVLTVHHEGTGPVKGRQDGAHVHSTVFSPDGRYLFVQDLGADKIYGYRYTVDGSRGLISPTDTRYTPVKPGSGPRHMVFGADGRFAYVTSELNASVEVFGYHDGKLTPVQTLPMSAPGFKGKVGGGAIHVSPDGRFVYASNRGDANDIVIYAVNQADGRLKTVGRQSSLGKTPREFLIDPSGKWLIVGNQDSDTFYVFSRDVESGQLGPNSQKVAVGSPVDFKLVPVEQ